MNPDRDDQREETTSQASESAAQHSESSPEPNARQEWPESPFAADFASPPDESPAGEDSFSDAPPDRPAIGEISGSETSLDEASAGDLSDADLPEDDSVAADGDSAFDRDLPAEAEVSESSSLPTPQMAQKLDREGNSGGISRGIYINGSGAAPVGSLQWAKTSSPQSGDVSAGQPPSAAAPTNPRLRPTADGGPALARPIVLVSLTTEDIHTAVNAALKLATDRDTKTLNQIADHKIELAFWKYNANQRVLHRR